MNNIIYTDRTRIEEYQRCPRKRYWGYHYQLPSMLAAGIQPAKPAIELTVGSAVHKGVEVLLKATIVPSPASLLGSFCPSWLLDKAIQDGLAEFDQAWQPWLERSDAYQHALESVGAPYNNEANQLLSYQLTEARAQIEALIAAFYYSPTGLQLLTENYEILAVEQEIQVPLADWLVLNSRPDAILRHRRTGQFFAWSLKTAKKWTDQTNQQAEVDNQGISESISTEYWLNNLYDKLPNDADPLLEGDPGFTHTVAGVLMCYLIKGEKRADEQGVYRTASPLIRPYFNTLAFDTIDPSNYAPTNKYTCTEEHEHKGARFNYKVNGKNGCPGGKNHMRGDTWQQVNIWEQGIAVRDWVRYLAEEQPDLLMSYVQVPAPYKREREELEDWIQEVIYKERELSDATRGMAMHPYATNLVVHTLNLHFPKSRTSCVYPFRCSMYDVCHKGGAARLLDPTLYQAEDPTVGLEVLQDMHYAGRVPNHPEGVTTSE